MKALQIEAPGKVHVVEARGPAPQTDCVRLRVHIVGLCGTDLNTFRGNNSMVQFPRILGHEVAATLLEPADTHNGRLAAGTAVTISPYTACGECSSCRQGRVNACEFNRTLGVQRDGAFIGEIVVSPEKIFTGKLSLKELALVEPLTVGCHAVARGRVMDKDTVAVFGCGGIGLGAIAASVHRGARTIAIDIDDAKLEIARKAGAKELINSKQSDLHERLQQITDKRGPDCIIEAIGLPETFRAAVEEVCFSGRVVYIGYAKEPVSYQTRLFVQKELDILGSRNALPEDFHEVIRMLERREFPVDAMVTAQIGMEEAPVYLQRWSDQPAAFTKILVQVS